MWASTPTDCAFITPSVTTQGRASSPGGGAHALIKFLLTIFLVSPAWEASADCAEVGRAKIKLIELLKPQSASLSGSPK